MNLDIATCVAFLYMMIAIAIVFTRMFASWPLPVRVAYAVTFSLSSFMFSVEVPSSVFHSPWIPFLINVIFIFVTAGSFFAYLYEWIPRFLKRYPYLLQNRHPRHDTFHSRSE